MAWFFEPVAWFLENQATVIFHCVLQWKIDIFKGLGARLEDLHPHMPQKLSIFHCKT